MRSLDYMNEYYIIAKVASENEDPALNKSGLEQDIKHKVQEAISSQEIEIIKMDVVQADRTDKV